MKIQVWPETQIMSRQEVGKRRSAKAGRSLSGQRERRWQKGLGFTLPKAGWDRGLEGSNVSLAVASIAKTTFQNRSLSFFVVFCFKVWRL